MVKFWIFFVFSFFLTVQIWGENHWNGPELLFEWRIASMPHSSDVFCVAVKYPRQSWSSVQCRQIIWAASCVHYTHSVEDPRSTQIMVGQSPSSPLQEAHDSCCGTAGPGRVSRWSRPGPHTGCSNNNVRCSLKLDKYFNCYSTVFSD